MIFFPAVQFDGIKSGAITLTFRAWDRARVKAGSMQRSHPIGVVAIEQVDAVAFSAITDDEAKRAGHASRAALAADLALRTGEKPTKSSVLWRVAFRYAGDADHAANATDASLAAADVQMIKTALADLDAKSASGSGKWTAKTLDLIAKRPEVAASELAKSVGRDTASFKADVVKLKKLGLTQSFSVGYRISPRGQAFLAARSRVSRKAGSKTPSTRTE